MSELEVLEAQRAWGQALVQISEDFETGGHAKASQTAMAAIDRTYGFGLGPVLFKPTLAVAPQTVRTDVEGALSYFVGGNPRYPEDRGFACLGWRSVEMRNIALRFEGSVALVMCQATFTNRLGESTTVDKTLGFVKDDRGAMRIVLHHSSLPYQPT